MGGEWTSAKKQIKNGKVGQLWSADQFMNLKVEENVQIYLENW